MDLFNKTILVVDDEEDILEVIKAYLIKEKYNVITANNGTEAINKFDDNIDLIILDLMMPKLSGEEVCKEIRLKSDVPIIMLTAKAHEEDMVNGLDIGADDYITKPFSPKELMARVRASLRRGNKNTLKADILEFNDGDLVIDTNKLIVKKKGNSVKLTITEFKILEILSKNKGIAFSRDDIIIKALGYDYEGNDRTIDAHIKNIRHKIEDDNKYIKTMHGLGYKFMED